MENSGGFGAVTSRSWPKTVAVSFATIGVFKGRRVGHTRPCLVCSREGTDNKPANHNTHLDTGLDDNGNHRVETDLLSDEGKLNGESDGESSRECGVCKSLLWNADAVVVSDLSNVVPSWLNSRATGALSFLWIALVSVFILANAAWYLYEFWGKVEGVTHMVSFLSYILMLMAVTMFCTIATGINYLRRVPAAAKPTSWTYLLDANYAARRLRSLTGRSSLQIPGTAFLVLGVLWATCNISLQIISVVHYLNSPDWHLRNTSQSHSIPAVLLVLKPDDELYIIFRRVKTILNAVSALCSLPIYVSFWHYVLVMRKGLEAELNLVLVFIKRNEGQLDWCRRRIAEIHYEFVVLQKVVARLMPFMVATGVLGITVHISWNYKLYGTDEKDLANHNLLINIFIFSEKFMLLVLPVLAVGGLNINHMWLQFTYALSRQRSTAREGFWDRVYRFTTELELEGGQIDVTVFLMIISLYLGRNLRSQDVDYTTTGL